MNADLIIIKILTIFCYLTNIYHNFSFHLSIEFIENYQLQFL